MLNVLILILSARWGAYNAHFAFLHEKSPYFALYFFQINTKLTTTPYFMLKCLYFNLAFSKIQKIVSKKNKLIRPPAR